VGERSGWTRRGFLSARGLGAMSGGLLGELVSDTSFSFLSENRTVLQLSMARRAMGCEFSVQLPAACPDGLNAGEAALDEIEEMERLLTVYADDSDAAYLNRHAAARPVRTDGRLFALLARSAELHRLTEGAFDVATHALLMAWGFFKGPRRVPDEPQRRAALACSGMRLVELAPADRTVRYLAEGVGINFGSIGKGYGIDRAIARLRDRGGVESILLQGGLSSVRAVGSPGRDGQGWRVGLQNPTDRRRRLATVRLIDRAMGTSGIDQQSFEAGGRRFGHILDPRTGWPVEPLASASAVAADAATADALATAFFVMGLDKTRIFCQNHLGIGALLVLRPDDRLAGEAERRGGFERRSVTRPQVVTFNLSARDVEFEPADAGRCRPT